MLITQGLSRSQGMVNKIGKAFGVQDIALASKGSGDETKVEISGYLLPGVQVRYSIGIFDSITEIAVRYQIMPQLYIEATNGLNNALDILYKFDWD
jgi:translocation and assembly module TamB